ncbi:MAG: hypothetical protein WCS37_10050 [Chloroflexota bacterium]|nr:hypothetical protein [Chloroflexota bacterium]
MSINTSNSFNRLKSNKTKRVKPNHHKLTFLVVGVTALVFTLVSFLVGQNIASTTLANTDIPPVGSNQNPEPGVPPTSLPVVVAPRQTTVASGSNPSNAAAAKSVPPTATARPLPTATPRPVVQAPVARAKPRTRSS